MGDVGGVTSMCLSLLRGDFGGELSRRFVSSRRFRTHRSKKCTIKSFES